MRQFFIICLSLGFGLLTLSLVILKVISPMPPTGTLSLPVVNSRNFFCRLSL